MLRVAIVHDWLTGMRGGERVLEGMLALFPNAEIFTLFHFPGSVSPLIEQRPIQSSVLQRAPFTRRGYRGYLPLFPLAMRLLRIRGFDLVLSNSACVAKAAITEGAPHLCYCATPMRYIWDEFDAYFDGSWLRRPAALAAKALRRWDLDTAGRVDSFVANSANVQDRIRRSYARESTVVHPPVDVARFRARRKPEDFYLVVSALVPYKRIEVAIRACALLGRRLVIAGDGPEAARLKKIAGPSVTFLGRVSDEEVASLYSRCRAFLFPGLEDFGITAVEAQAAGAPVVALAAGGVLETVSGPLVNSHGEVVRIFPPLRHSPESRNLPSRHSRESGNPWREGPPHDSDLPPLRHSRESGNPRRGGPHHAMESHPTGVFFLKPTPESMAGALRHFEGMEFNEAVSRRNAERFAPQRFQEQLLAEIVRMVAQREASSRAALELATH